MHRLVVPFLAVLLVLAGCNGRPASEGDDNGQPITGAHPIHLAGPISQPLSCGECHAPNWDVVFPAYTGSLARANGANPSLSISNLTCSNVYCHAGGATAVVFRGATPAPVWNPPTSLTGCQGCHATPGGVAATPWHPAVATGVQCAMCHPGYTNSTVNRAVHVNGVVNLQPTDIGTSCAACHGDRTRVIPAGSSAALKAAPPANRYGNTATTDPGGGAHQAHPMPGATALSSPIACNECHVVPTDLAHVGPVPDSPVTFSWGPIATAESAVPAFDTGTLTCANYCHGQTLNGGGTYTTPIWNKVDGTQARCGSCHGSPPSDLPHVLHAAPGQVNLACSKCHPAGYSIAAVLPQAVPYHVNGVRNVNTANLPAWKPNAAGPNGWTGTSTGVLGVTTGCHGGVRYWKQGIPNTTCF